MDRDFKRNTSAQNRFVPQGSKNGRGNGAHPTADASVSIGLEQGGYGTDPVPRHPYGALGPDQQDFNDLNDAITNILEGDTSNSVAIRNPARTGALRVTANQRVAEPPATTAKHYHATTTYTYNYLYMFLYAMSILASIIYVIVRLIYIGQGRQSVEIPLNRGFFDEDGNVITAGELMEEVGLGVGEEIPQSVLDNPRYEVLRRIVDDNTYSFWWSCCVLAAEIGGFVLVHLSQQMFRRQDTKFYEMSPERVAQLREIVARRGVLQLVNIMVCTYNEPVETVKLCVEHLLAAEAPVYCKKVVYIGDDGAKKKFQCSEDKRLMCEEFARRGHTNVIWVGDRKALPHQLNGKSSNINHMVLKHMYPNIRQTADIPHKDILMVMDCDHLVEPEFFAKACAVMLDKECAVCLIPQSFHNEVQPDCFDNSNYNFMFRLMPYYFGAGCCFVTGTNVMVRARAAFMACRFDENPHGHETQSLPSGTKKLMEEQLQGDAHRQLFSEVLVAEDIDLGSRVHTLGFRSVFLAEVLAKGEVPRDARSIWKQRSRWAAAAHMYILDPSSVFWRRQPHMSFWQKSLYWIPMILHWTLIWSEPIMFTMPIMCLVFNICPYGIDPLLWFTHFAKLVTTVLVSSYADTLELSRAAIYGQTMARVLFFVNVKAVLNTIMVYTGWKRPGAFKVTVKAGGAPKPAAGAAEEKPAEPKPVEEEVERDNGGPMIPRVLKGLRLYKIHDALSKVTEARKKVMPWEGTFDFWVLLGITLMNLFAVTVGFIRLGNKSAIISVSGCENENVQLIALVFGFIEAVPGLLFIMYMAVQEHAEWVMKIWVPLLIGSVSIVCILIEFRVGVQYIGQLLDNPDFLPQPGECAEAQPGV